MSADVQRLHLSLQALKYVDYSSVEATHKTNCKADRVLSLIFEIGCKKGFLSLTQAEKRDIIEQLGEVLKAIQINIRSTYWQYRKRVDGAVLRKRSAVQFLIDDFGTLTAGNSEFDKLIKESKEILDKIISYFTEESDSELVSSEEEEPTEVRISPQSHTWWNR